MLRESTFQDSGTTRYVRSHSMLARIMQADGPRRPSQEEVVQARRGKEPRVRRSVLTAVLARLISLRRRSYAHDQHATDGSRGPRTAVPHDPPPDESAQRLRRGRSPQRRRRSRASTSPLSLSLRLTDHHARKSNSSSPAFPPLLNPANDRLAGQSNAPSSRNDACSVPTASTAAETLSPAGTSGSSSPASKMGTTRRGRRLLSRGRSTSGVKRRSRWVAGTGSVSPLCGWARGEG